MSQGEEEDWKQAWYGRRFVKIEMLHLCFIVAEELAENSNVQDAFVIAVEQQARY